MQANELLVGHMRLHNSQGLHRSLVGWTWCVKKSASRSGVWPISRHCGLKIPKALDAYSSAHSDPKEVDSVLKLGRPGEGLCL